jgi:hypothetical protein
VTRSRFAMALVCTIVLAACQGSVLPAPVPTDIPIAGVREPMTRQDLAAARDGMAGGLVEPAWLPDGFRLVHIGYCGALEQSTDLYYDDGEHYLHIWQAHRDPAELGNSDPVPLGEPMAIGGDVEWHANTRVAAQTGRIGVVEYSARWPDGRTISVDSDLDSDLMVRVLESIAVRHPE